jgi:hypothetical protein
LNEKEHHDKFERKEKWEYYLAQIAMILVKLKSKNPEIWKIDDFMYSYKTPEPIVPPSEETRQAMLKMNKERWAAFCGTSMKKLTGQDEGSNNGSDPESPYNRRADDAECESVSERDEQSTDREQPTPASDSDASGST